MVTQDTITRSAYRAGGQAIATRVSGDLESDNNGLFYIHSDHTSASSIELLSTGLGSATFMTHGNGHASEGLKVANSTKLPLQAAFSPFGEYRIQPSYPTSDITDRGFTGHKHNDEIGLIYMNARYYVPGIGRFTSADSIVPNPGNPQSFNRFSYVFNNPVKYIDPTGHDPLDEAWEEAFEEENGRAATDEDRQDYLFSLIYLGSGPCGEWTEADWLHYFNNRDSLWSGQLGWYLDNPPAGLDRFILHLDRLSSYYYEGHDEMSQFVRAVGLVWGGISYEGGIEIALLNAGVGNTLAQLHEGNEGWNMDYVDDENPAHHWAGAFVTGYARGAIQGILANTIRDGLQKITGQGGSKKDIIMGNKAALQGDAFYGDTHGLFREKDPFAVLFESMRTDLGSSSN